MSLRILTLALATLLVPAAWSGDTVAVDQLPAAVKATVTKESKGGTVESVDKETNKSGETVYVAHLKIGEKSSSVTIAADGHVVHEKEKKKK